MSPPINYEAFLVLTPLAVLLVVAGLVWWIARAKPRPDPWGPEIDAVLEAPETLPVCHHCFSPQEDPNWFCPECGASIGPYNNLMPYLNLFAEGEVLRVGTVGRWRQNGLMLVGFVLLSIAAYAIVAPVYCYFLLKNRDRQRLLVEEGTGEEILTDV